MGIKNKFYNMFKLIGGFFEKFKFNYWVRVEIVIGFI